MGVLSQCLLFVYTLAMLCVQYGDGQSAEEAMRYNYNRNNDYFGVHYWSETFSDHCGGRRQSPIDIQTNALAVMYNMTPCECPFLGYNNRFLYGDIKNNGHSPKFAPDPNFFVTMHNVPGRKDEYRLHNVHIHYGRFGQKGYYIRGRYYQNTGTMAPGSEHTIDGFRFDGEIHFVFYNARYGSLHDAIEEPDGLVVLAFLIQQTSSDGPLSMETQQLSYFLESFIPRITLIGQKVHATLDLNMFFNRPCEFYTYQGSLTTPPCLETVEWIIFRRPILVTEDSWRTLSQLHSVAGSNSRYGSYRETQPLFERRVMTNFGPLEQCGSLIY